MNKIIKSFLFVWKSILFEKKWLLIGTLLTLFLSLLIWLGPRCIGWIVDQAVIPRDPNQLKIGLLALFLIEGFRLLTNYLSQTAYAILGQNVIERVRAQLIQHLLKLPISYFDKVSSGRMMTRVVSDVNSLSDFFQSGFVSVLGNAANVVAIFVGLFMLNVKLGILLFIAFIPITIACGFFSRRLKGAYENSRNQLSSLNAMLADFLFGMKTIRSLSMNRSKYNELDVQIDHYANAQMNAVRTFALFHPTVSLGIGVLLLLHIIFGLTLVESNTLKVGEWIAGLSYVLFLQQPLVEISDRWNFFLIGLTGVDRILEVLEVEPEKVGEKSPEPFQEIRFENTSFRYDRSGVSQELALENATVTLKKGDWVGIYGESGSGKSTFLQLIYGFYVPTSGSIFWNGLPYADLNRLLITQKFGVIEQFPFIFSGTVLENITLFGNHKVDVEALKIELKGNLLIEKILADPLFEIHERGTNLSMGQKQMIAFLRAYLARPEIWVLDEATAFFDEATEQEVMSVLIKLNTERSITVIQVAHRPQALKRMKRWIEVDSAHLTEKTQ